MTIETWIQEFYPVTAEQASTDEVEAVKHSIKKWRGLTKENLEKHLIEKIYYSIEDDTSSIVIDSENCALCHYSGKLKGDSISISCTYCPIFKSSGNCCSDQYSLFDHESNPHPMIELLEKTLKWVENKNESSTSTVKPDTTTGK